MEAELIELELGIMFLDQQVSWFTKYIFLIKYQNIILFFPVMTVTMVGYGGRIFLNAASVSSYMSVEKLQGFLSSLASKLGNSPTKIVSDDEEHNDFKDSPV